MTLCSDDHEEICFEGKSCPLCDANSKNGDLERQVESLQEQIDEQDKHDCNKNCNHHVEN